MDSHLQITVLYFAALRERMGVDEQQRSLPSRVCSVGDLLVQLETDSALAGRLASVRVAVNETFVTKDFVIRPGDVVALIPPVAGG